MGGRGVGWRGSDHKRKRAGVRVDRSTRRRSGGEGVGRTHARGCGAPRHSPAGSHLPPTSTRFC